MRKYFLLTMCALFLPMMACAQAEKAEVDSAAFHQDATCPEVLIETNMGNIRVALYNDTPLHLSLIHISEPTRLGMLSRMPSSA